MNPKPPAPEECETPREAQAIEPSRLMDEYPEPDTESFDVAAVEQVDSALIDAPLSQI